MVPILPMGSGASADGQSTQLYAEPEALILVRDTLQTEPAEASPPVQSLLGFPENSAQTPLQTPGPRAEALGPRGTKHGVIFHLPPQPRSPGPQPTPLQAFLVEGA